MRREAEGGTEPRTIVERCDVCKGVLRELRSSGMRVSQDGLVLQSGEVVHGQRVIPHQFRLRLIVPNIP